MGLRSMDTTREHEQGVVSIFIVVFFALLISVIAMSFIGIVIRDANQSTNNDLSRSAYDSAQAGVEDAKRAISLYNNACNSGSSNCGTYANYLDNEQCGALPGFASALGLRSGTGSEILVQSNANNSFNQAYTCVNVTMKTPDYINDESPYQSDIIPLKATSAATGVTLNWFTHTDAGTADGTPFTPRTTGANALPREGAWDQNAAKKYTPALLRVQLISYDDAISDAELKANNRTIFLYPSTSGVTNADFDTLSKVPPDADNPTPIVAVRCNGTQYACSINLGLGSNAGNTSFLRVTPIYKKTTFQLELTGPSDPLFDGVQPIVDSTGRANDLFRRVQARVRLQNQVVYPEYAVDSNNSFCKNFSVSSDPADFVNNCP